MKKKGFTLIELLAVIVILAIIALIAIPMITKVVDKSRKSAALASANGYIEAIYDQTMIAQLNPALQKIEDGTHNVNDLNVKVKGQTPTNGVVIVEKSKVTEAKLCIGKYSIDYDGKESKISNNDYCGENKVTILSNGEVVNTSTKSTNKFTVDLTNKTNINCSNGAIPKVNGNELTVNNVIGNVTCDIGSSLKYTFTHLNNGINNIIMVNDETMESTLLVPSDKKVNFDLNGKILKTVNNSDLEETNTTFSSKLIPFTIEGTLVLNDNIGTGIVDSYIGSPIAYVRKEGSLIVNSGHYIGRNFVQNYSSNSNGVVIKDGYFESKAYAVIYTNLNEAVTRIYGGTFINKFNNVVSADKGNTVIITKDKPIYMRSDVTTWKPAILNCAKCKINIKANQANQCTNNSSDTTSGLCIYAEGDGSGESSTNGNVAIQVSGKANINGGTYYGGWAGIYGSIDSTINIVNANIISERNAIGVSQNNTTTMNICNSKLYSKVYDIANLGTGTNAIINYSSSVVFTNGSNTPSVYNPSGTVNANYIGTCTQ